MGCEMFQAYRIRCLVSGRSYIGITARPVHRRWAEHWYSAARRPGVSAVNLAMAKHGADAFEFDVIAQARTWDDLCELEAILIRQHGTRSPQGYNLSAGGEGALGAIRSPETRELMAAARRGKPRLATTKAKLSAWRKGKSFNAGEKNGGAKLTVEQVRDIRAELAVGVVQRRLAERYGVSFTAIWRIANNLKWKAA